MDDFNQRYLDFSKPFINAIKEVYDTMMSTELVHGTPVLKEKFQQQADYTAIMGITGKLEKKEGGSVDFKGSFFISWPEVTYIKSASEMMMEEYTEYNEEIADVGMEICNITMGNAKKVLATTGFLVEMSIPSSVTGKSHSLGNEKNIQTVMIPLTSKLGDFFIGVNYTDSDL